LSRLQVHEIWGLDSKRIRLRRMQLWQARSENSDAV
jgi:hypothetical protein